MKKLLLIAIVSLVTFASCTKEGKLNRKLDGSWSVVSYNGQAMTSDFSMTVEFNKDKKDDGKYTITTVFMGTTDTDSGTYQLTKDDAITLTSDSSEKMTVTSYSKTDLTLTAESGEILILKKK